MLTLGQAARLTGTSKTTLARAIKAGRLSAIRREDGSYSIDPAELSRVYTVTPETVPLTGAVVHRTTVLSDTDATGETLALRAEIDGLRAQLALMREYAEKNDRHAEELKVQRYSWQRQAESAQRLLVDARPARHGLFGFLKAL